MKRSRLGKIFIIIGLIISLNPYLIIFFGGSLFIVGSIIYWTTEKSRKLKFLWTITPMLIWYPLMLSLFWISGIIGTATAQKRDYIIHENFKGKIKIIESECGKVPLIKAGRIQFEIPENCKGQ